MAALIHSLFTIHVKMNNLKLIIAYDLQYKWTKWTQRIYSYGPNIFKNEIDVLVLVAPDYSILALRTMLIKARLH